MRFLKRLGSLWRGAVRRSRMDDELDEELRGYFEELVRRRLPERPSTEIGSGQPTPDTLSSGGDLAIVGGTDPR